MEAVRLTSYPYSETNSEFAPKNGASKKESSLPTTMVQVRAATFREAKVCSSYPTIYTYRVFMGFSIIRQVKDMGMSHVEYLADLISSPDQ